MENTESYSENSSRQSSSLFLPFVIVTVTFVLLNILQLVGVLQTRTRLQANFEQLAPVVGRAQQVSGVLEKVSRDILAIAPSNSNADRIRKEFGIRDNAAAAAPAPAPDAAPAPAPTK
jgi:hypothetical protein